VTPELEIVGQLGHIAVFRQAWWASSR
jgi:hypothetical protein